MVGTLGAQSVEITALGNNGELSWTAPSGSVATIEWASSLSAQTDWNRHWVDLSDIMSTGTQSSAQVPMFYRVTCWTNGTFLSMPVGRTCVYRVTPTNGVPWTNEWKCIGYVEGPTLTNASHYGLISQTVAGQASYVTFGSTDVATYHLRPNGIVDLKWQDAPIGTTWTNATDPDGDTMAVKILTNETVDVPAGSFSDCIMFQEYDINEPLDGNHENHWWIKPGFALIKYIDHYGDHDVWELVSWTDE